MVLTLSEDLDKFTFAQPELDFFKDLQFTFDMPVDKASSKDQQQQQQRRRRNSNSQRQLSSSHSRPSEGEASSDSSILQTDPHLPAQINSFYDFQSQYSGFLNQYLSSQHGIPPLLGNHPGPQPYPPIHDDPMTSLDRLLISDSNRYSPSDSSSQPIVFPNPFGQQPVQLPPNLSSFFYESSSPYSQQSTGKTPAFPSFSAQISQQPQPGGSTSHRSPSLPSSSSAAQASQQQQQGADTITDAEDKRRRNTAASARFRMKKKQRTVNLERSVADLTGRAEELNREAADLRRENGWLKEIIVMRGRTLQRSSIPGEEYFMPPPRLQGSEQAGTSVGAGAGARSTSSGDRSDDRPESESEEEEEEEEEREEKADKGSSEANASVSRSPPNRRRASSKRSKGKGKSRDPN